MVSSELSFLRTWSAGATFAQQSPILTAVFRDCFDLKPGVLLPVTGFHPDAFLGFVTEDCNFRSFHLVDYRGLDFGVVLVTSFGQISESEFWINAGFFCLRSDIFDYIEEGEELVEQPFRRLIAKSQLSVYRYCGFWQQMDTFKDKIAYDRMESRGDCPWMLWNRRGPPRCLGSNFHPLPEH